MMIKNLFRSVKHAIHGIWLVFRYEQNFRIHCVAALCVIGALIIFQPPKQEALLVIIVIISILVLEIINSVLERLIDVLKPRLHHQVKIIKDMMAAMVLIASIGAVVVGALVFVPYIFEFFIK